MRMKQLIVKLKTQSAKLKPKTKNFEFHALTLRFTFYALRFLVALFFVFILGCTKKEIRNIDSKGKNIICFGDSLTFGYGANPGEDYPAALAKIIGLPVINAGQDADTTYEALKRIESDVLNKDPRLVIIEFCGNDFLKKIPLEVTVENIKKMAQAVQAKGAMTAIVDISAGMFLGEYRSGFKKLSTQTGSIFISGVLNGIITNPSMKSDFLHPNAKGYRIISQRIHRTIAPYLTQDYSKK